jgi:hypothetical protein
MCLYVFLVNVIAKRCDFSKCWHPVHWIEHRKHIELSTKTPLNFSGLEHPPADVYLTVCSTEPLGLYILGENDVFIPYFHIQVIHTDTHRYIQYKHIRTNTYTYIHINTISNHCREGFWCCSGGCTRFTCAEPPIQVISSQRGLGAGSPSAKCVWNVYWLRRGCTLDPLTHAARAGVPKRVPGWVTYGGKKWSATCPGVPWVRPASKALILS